MSSFDRSGPPGEPGSGSARDAATGAAFDGALFDVFAEGVAICAADGRLLYENDSLAQMCECDPEHARLLAGICALAREAVEGAARRDARDARDATYGDDRFDDDVRDERESAGGIAARTVRTAGVRYELRATVIRERGLFGRGAALVSASRVVGGLPSLETLRARFALTLAEARIVPLLAARRTNAQIANALGISPHTVRHHAERAFLKLCVHRRTEIAERLSRFICI